MDTGVPRSDFRTTSAAGTRRLAAALRDATRQSEDVSIKSEIAAAVTLAGSLSDQSISAADFIDRFGLSPAARAAVQKQVRDTKLLNEKFVFDQTEFSAIMAYRTVELDTGALLSAEVPDFDSVFKRVEAGDGFIFTAEGRIVSEKLGKSKAGS